MPVGHSTITVRELNWMENLSSKVCWWCQFIRWKQMYHKDKRGNCFGSYY